MLRSWFEITKGCSQYNGKLLSVATSRLVFLNYTYDIHPNSQIYVFHNILL